VFFFFSFFFGLFNDINIFGKKNSHKFSQICTNTKSEQIAKKIAINFLSKRFLSWRRESLHRVQLICQLSLTHWSRQKVYSQIQYGVSSCRSHTISSKSRSQKSFTPESYTNVKGFFFTPPPGFFLAKFFFKVAKIYSLYLCFFFGFLVTKFRKNERLLCFSNRQISLILASSM